METTTIELDWIDNVKNESFVFVPDLGFAYFEPHSFRLNRLKRATGGESPGLIKSVLGGP